MSSRRRNQRGNTLIEFALSWAMFSLMFTGIFQYGYTFWVYNRLATSVADAAQYAALLDFDAGNTASYAMSVKNMVVYGNPNGTGTPVVTGISTANITVDPHSAGGFPTYVTVSITSFSVNAVFGTQSFSGKPRVTVRWVGQVTCKTGGCA